MTKEDNYKVDINGMYYLIFAVYTEYQVKQKYFPYENLKSQVESYQITNTPFDPEVHNIDDFMVDAYKIYHKYMSIEDKIGEIISALGMEKMAFGMFDLSEDRIKEELNRITATFEDIILHCDFEGPQIKGIQINLLKDKMSEAIENENYELAAVIRDKMND